MLLVNYVVGYNEYALTETLLNIVSVGYSDFSLNTHELNRVLNTGIWMIKFAFSIYFYLMSINKDQFHSMNHM